MSNEVEKPSQLFMDICVETLTKLLLNIATLHSFLVIVWMQVKCKVYCIWKSKKTVRDGLWLFPWNILEMYVTSHSCMSFYCRRMPSLLEYLSYNCNFMGILAGPLCSYKDYITFIEGRSYHMAQSGENGKEEVQYEKTEPSPNVRFWEPCGNYSMYFLVLLT